MTSTTTRRIEVFRPGTFVPMSGAPVTMTADDLKAIAAAYDPAGAPTPIVVGHPKTEDPAYGWASAFSYDETTQRLVADVGQIEPAFGEAVTAGRYKRISLSLFSPQAPNNPKPGAWYPKHIGFLGAAAPAVSGLAPVHFAEDQTGVITVEFGDPAFKDIAAIFRSVRDWFFEREGADVADKIVPAWTVNWIDEAGRQDPRLPTPAFTEPAITKPVTEPEPIMSEADKTAQAERERVLAAREEAVNKRHAELTHADHASFAEALVEDGRLLPATRDQVVALLDTLAASSQPVEVSFAEGDATITKSATETVRAILQAQPKVVSFGEFATREATLGRSVDFAAPAGQAIDADRLRVHAAAEAYIRKHPGTDYLAAVRAVEAGG